jgi:protein O-mannosyl-transferase
VGRGWHGSRLVVSCASSPWLRAVTLLGLTFVAWRGVVGGTFQFDDFDSVLVEPAGTAWRIRPLLALTWGWDRAVHGLHAADFLAENLVLHCLTVLVVFALFQRVLPGLGAFLAGAVFALQPAHAEVVAYVSGRSTGLMALLLLSALWAWSRWAVNVHSVRRRWWIALALLLFIGAVLVKEVALVFPLLLVVWGRLALRAHNVRRTILPFIAVGLVLSLGLAAIPRYWALAEWSLAQHSPLEALATNASVIPFQLSLWFRPGALSVEHPLQEARLPLALAAALLATAAGVAFAARRRAPRLALAVAWAGTVLLPTQSFLLKADAVTEKPLYLAWVGVALLGGSLLAGAFERLRRLPGARLVLAAALGCFALGAGVSVGQRVETWADPVRLWGDATRKAPGSSRAWNNLGNALAARSPDQALFALRRSLAIDPFNRHALANLDRLEALCPSACPAP